MIKLEKSYRLKTSISAIPSHMTDQSANETEQPDLENEDNVFRITDDDIKQATDAVRAQDSDTINAMIDELKPADAAELIEKVAQDERLEMLDMFSDNINSQIFSELDPELRRNLMENMEAADVANILSDLDSDDALDIIEDLDEDFQKEIIRKLSAKTRLALEEGLSFPEDSAGRLMQREVVAIPEFWTVGKAIDYLREAKDELPEEFFDVVVISPTHHVIGEIRLDKLISSKRNKKLVDLIKTDSHLIPADMDQEEVADIFRRYNMLSTPVVDANNRLLGVITIDDIIDVIDEEAEEDILKMGGVDQGDFYRAIMATTGTRFRWLFVNLLTAIMASVVISFFDATIEQIVALAVLMPIVASMGGNAGTQALTVAVRALATKELSETNAWRIIGKETAVGTLNGILFAALAGAATAIWFSSPMLGLVIAMAMVINLLVAGMCGAGVPIMLQRMGADPAVASAVVLTTVTDVVGFFAFLGLAALMLL